MKKTLKLFVLAAAMLFGTQAFGQVTVTAGYQQPSYSAEGFSWNINGFYAGVMTQFQMTDMLYFEPGLLFDFGAKDGDSVSYLRLPLHLGAGFALGNGFELFANAGPGVAIGLFGSIPSLSEDVDRLTPIPGLPANPEKLPEGCHFNPRCSHCTAACQSGEIPWGEVTPGHFVRCTLCAGKKAE